MSKYLNSEHVCSAFTRLSSRNNTGKTHMERTSILMYFLAVDATCKHFGVDVLDLDPVSLEGKNYRKHMELEFVKLVLVENTSTGPKQVIQLGKIDVSGTSPEKRISSNFFTVPLKKASGQVDPYYYPRRPAAPILKMGPAATGRKWGIGYHDDWKLNFLALLTEIKSPTPLMDLAIFVCRSCAFEDSTVDFILAFREQLKKRFTDKIVDFWMHRIAKEKVLARPIDNLFSDHYSSFVTTYKEGPTSTKRYDQMKKSELIDLIHQLESKLRTAEKPVN